MLMVLQASTCKALLLLRLTSAVGTVVLLVTRSVASFQLKSPVG